LSLVRWCKAAFLLRFTTDFEFGKSINLILVKSINCCRQVEPLLLGLGLAELHQLRLHHVSTQLLESVGFFLRAREDALEVDPIE